jgi:hypothetical protein
MFSVKRSCSVSLFLILNFSFLIFPAHAQFWHALPPIGSTPSIDVSFSDDGKKVFYLATKDGVGNVWGMVIMDKYGGIIADPKNPAIQITKFTDRGIVRFFHLLNKPQIVFMHAMENGKDFHIYRMKDDGSEQPQDLTPGGEGVTNVIIGASNNGRYVYYTNNSVHHDKVDVYRYDTQQYTSDLIFPNDKDYQVLAWTHDQRKLLIKDSSTNSFKYYDIETTQWAPLEFPADGKVIDVILDPSSQTPIALDEAGQVKTWNGDIGMAHGWRYMRKDVLSHIDYSPNGKFIITHSPGMWEVRDIVSGENLKLPEGAHPLAIAPKETMLVYSIPVTRGSNLFLYDIAKKASVQLGEVN